MCNPPHSTSDASPLRACSSPQILRDFGLELAIGGRFARLGETRALPTGASPRVLAPRSQCARQSLTRSRPPPDTSHMFNGLASGVAGSRAGFASRGVRAPRTRGMEISGSRGRQVRECSSGCRGARLHPVMTTLIGCSKGFAAAPAGRGFFYSAAHRVPRSSRGDGRILTGFLEESSRRPSAALELVDVVRTREALLDELDRSSARSGAALAERRERDASDRLGGEITVPVLGWPGLPPSSVRVAVRPAACGVHDRLDADAWRAPRLLRSPRARRDSLMCRNAVPPAHAWRPNPTHDEGSGCGR